MRGAILVLAVVGSEAWAGPVTIWLEPELPEVTELERADNLTGGTDHLPLRELLYPPTPEVEADTQHVEDVRAALASAAERWDEFEIELPIATDLSMTLDDVSLVRSREDAEAVFRALVLQGAAVLRAFEADQFGVADQAAPWRVMAGDTAVPLAWVTAYGILPSLGREAVARQDLVDSAGWQDWERLRGAITGMHPGTITWDPGAGTLWVDGREISETDGDVVVRAGRHQVHLVRDGAVCGRARIDVLPDGTVGVPSAASTEHVEAARAAVLNETAGELPEDVRAAITALGERHGGPVYLGVMGPRRSTIVPFGEHRMEVERTFTALITADVGGGVLSTRLFEQAQAGSKPTAGAFSGGAGFEFGISYFLIGVGLDAVVTPGRTVQYANADGETNSEVSVYLQPHGGVGVYILRPVSDTPTLSVAADVAWMGPAHLGFGGRVAVGVPIDGKHNWFRVIAGTTYGPRTLWKLPEDPVPELSAWLRIGLGARL